MKNQENPKPNPVAKFGEFVTNHFRDRGLDYLSMVIDGTLRDQDSQELNRWVRSLPESGRLQLRRCVAAATDHAMHDFLFALEEANESDAGMSVVVDAENIADLSDGLQGEPFGDSGWIAAFSDYDQAGNPRTQKDLSE